jgi:hypothetical protein
VTSSRPVGGSADAWDIELEGGTQPERDAVSAYARKFVEG